MADFFHETINGSRLPIDPLCTHLNCVSLANLKNKKCLKIKHDESWFLSLFTVLPSSTLIEIDVGSNHARGCGFLFQTFSFRLLFIYLTRYSEERA